VWPSHTLSRGVGSDAAWTIRDIFFDDDYIAHNVTVMLACLKMLLFVPAAI